ncbi:hypothetical protein DPMN_146319 [Dreissena polymorpha]|uniref:NR LBD domain-containing protein n=2 Tax=Dreissena polymorpha TaxID=45954 RepID=A0A9D4F5P4_DREPO|nr:hypothetical protein DPMN_146319 [Dreissena polymorpha]
MSPPGSGYESPAGFHFNGVYPTFHHHPAAAHLQPHPTHSVYRNILSHKGRYANVNLATPLWPDYGGRSERSEPPYPSSADGDHERPRSSGEPARTASSDQTSVSSAEMKSERTDGGLEAETISVSRSPSPQSFQGASPQSNDTSMPDFNSSSDSKHSSGSESEDHKPIVVSEKSRGDSPTVSSTVTASHQDSRGSPPSQRTSYHHPSAGAAPVGFGFRYTTFADVNMNMYPHAQRAPVEQTYEAAAKLLFMSVKWARNIPSFLSLPFRDQAILLEESWSELFILSAAQWALPLDIVELMGSLGFTPSDQSERAVLLHAQLRALVDVISRCAGHRVDSTEYACLKALVLFKPEIKGLRDGLQVDALQDQAQIMLSDYCVANHPANKVRFGKLLLILPVLRAVTPRSIEEVFFRRTIGSVPIERLLCDMFKSC